MDSMNMDTVCRLYEVGRQRLAEDEEDEEEDQVRNTALTYLLKSSCYLSACERPQVFSYYSYASFVFISCDADIVTFSVS